MWHVAMRLPFDASFSSSLSLSLCIAMHMVNVVIYEFVFIFRCKIRPRWCAPPLPSTASVCFGSGYMWLERQAKCNILVYFYPLEVAAHSSPKWTNERTTTNHFHVIYVLRFHHLSLDFILSPIWWISIRPTSNDSSVKRMLPNVNTSGASESETQNKRKWKCRRKANVRARLQTLCKWLESSR